VKTGTRNHLAKVIQKAKTTYIEVREEVFLVAAVFEEVSHEVIVRVTLVVQQFVSLWKNALLHKVL